MECKLQFDDILLHTCTSIDVNVAFLSLLEKVAAMIQSFKWFVFIWSVHVKISADRHTHTHSRRQRMIRYLRIIDVVRRRIENFRFGTVELNSDLSLSLFLSQLHRVKVISWISCFFIFIIITVAILSFGVDTTSIYWVCCLSIRKTLICGTIVKMN